MKARYKAFLLGFACVPFACAQIFGDAPGKGAAQSVDADCNAFAQVAKQFLNSRGLKVAQGYTKVDEDWACGQPGYRCIVFRNAPPRTAEGKSLSRDEVVSGYLSGPVDFRWKNLTRGYWVAPDHNFVMGASLQLKKEPVGCTAKLFMSFGLGGMEFLGIIPFDLYTWPVPPDNGRLQKEYLTAVVNALPK